MKKIPILAGLTTLSLIVGCGGGSSTTDTAIDTTLSSTDKKASITGTVPGTLIEAFCEDGSYYKTTSNDNGTTQHPFTLELPQTLQCKVVMTTNENDPDPTQRIITPLVFINGDSSSSTIILTQSVDIGYVPLTLKGSGLQSPLDLNLNTTALQPIELSYDPLDKDGDHIPDIYEDSDNDGIVNMYDEDDDNDGIKDEEDDDYSHDHDGDGIEDQYDIDQDNDGEPDSTLTITQTLLPTSYTPDAGRLLSSACAQCHGTDGISVTQWDSIAGEAEFAYEHFMEYPIMQAQADGYTLDEKITIDSYLATLSNYDDNEAEKYEKDNDDDDENENENDDKGEDDD